MSESFVFIFRESRTTYYFFHHTKPISLSGYFKQATYFLTTAHSSARLCECLNKWHAEEAFFKEIRT